MALKTKLSYEVEDKLAKIEYFDDTTLLTSWTEQNGTITALACAANPSVDVDEAKAQTFLTKKWIDFVQGQWNPSRIPTDDWTCEVEANGGVVKAKFKVRSTTILDAEWSVSDPQIALAARPAGSISWGTYLKYIEAWDRFYQAIDHEAAAQE